MALRCLLAAGKAAAGHMTPARVAALAAAACALTLAAWPLAAPASGPQAQGYAIDELVLLRWVTIGVAVANLGIAASLWLASRRKAEAEALRLLEDDLRGELKEHAHLLHQVGTTVAGTPTHKHLAELARDVKAMGAQVNQLAGQVEGMNDNLRLLLAQTVRGGSR